MTQNILKVKTEVSAVTPGNKEQRDKLNKIQAEIAKVEKVLELADEAMERNDSQKEKLLVKYEEC